MRQGCGNNAAGGTDGADAANKEGEDKAIRAELKKLSMWSDDAL